MKITALGFCVKGVENTYPADALVVLKILTKQESDTCFISRSP